MASLDFDGLIRRHLEAANHNDFDTMDELFSADYTLELPQSGERIKGKAKIRDLHVSYPANVHFVTRRVVGQGELAVWEGTISYNDGTPMNRVAIFEFSRRQDCERDGLFWRCLSGSRLESQVCRADDWLVLREKQTGVCILSLLASWY